jgi:hemerythrin-like domain-containing protein
VSITIIDGLVAEHRVFLTIFDQIERSLPEIKTTGEIALICRILERLIHDHGTAETDLAYITFDHVLKEQGRCTRLSHDHEEIDGLLREVETIQDLGEARSRLKVSLNACRIHFKDEERNVFPLIEKTVHHETLVALGRAWKSQSYLTQPPAGPERPGSSKKKT